MTTFEESLSSGAGQSFKFGTVGDKISGEVAEKSMVDTTDFDGNAETVPVITLSTDDGDWDVWLGKAAQRSAVGRALSAHGAGTKLEIGGQLAIRRVEDGVAKKAGYSPPHLFEAQYLPPSPAAPEPEAAPPSGADLFG